MSAAAEAALNQGETADWFSQPIAFPSKCTIRFCSLGLENREADTSPVVQVTGRRRRGKRLREKKPAQDVLP